MIHNLGRKPGRRLSRFFRRERGTATIEFVFVVPIALAIFMASMEAGLYMIRHTMMERGLDIALRDFRLGRMDRMTHDEIRDAICDQSTILSNCKTEMKVWMEPLDTTSWNLTLDDVYCGDKNNPLIQPLLGHATLGNEHELVIVRVCTLQKPIFPSTGFALRLRADSQTGRYELATATIVTSEPR